MHQQRNASFSIFNRKVIKLSPTQFMVVWVSVFPDFIQSQWLHLLPEWEDKHCKGQTILYQTVEGFR